MRGDTPPWQLPAALALQLLAAKQLQALPLHGACTGTQPCVHGGTPHVAVPNPLLCMR